LLNIFLLVYTVVAIVLYILALPALLLYSLKDKYRVSIPARFFLWKNSPLDSDGIWIHSCSFGEARAIAPLLKHIPTDKLRLTTTTHTGYQEISKHTKQSRYLPYEIWLYIWVKPQRLLIVMEAELWYLLFFIVGMRGGNRVLINARMSERSYPKYLKFRWLYQKIFAQIDRVYAQSIDDKYRLESLGATNIKVIGNIKFVDIPKPTKRLDKPKGTVVCAGSTHQGEEELILEAFISLKREEIDAKLIVVPRHPERFDSVDILLNKFSTSHNFTYERYSQHSDMRSDILLIDTLGELVNIYAISDIVILGGAFEPIGGHNAAEVAQFGSKIISGEHYFNQKDIFAGIEGITISTRGKLPDILKNHKTLPSTKIIANVDISSIIDEIKRSIIEDVS